MKSLQCIILLVNYSEIKTKNGINRNLRYVWFAHSLLSVIDEGFNMIHWQYFRHIPSAELNTNALNIFKIYHNITGTSVPWNLGATEVRTTSLSMIYALIQALVINGLIELVLLWWLMCLSWQLAVQVRFICTAQYHLQQLNGLYRATTAMSLNPAPGCEEEKETQDSTGFMWRNSGGWPHNVGGLCCTHYVHHKILHQRVLIISGTTTESKCNSIKVSSPISPIILIVLRC